jgi:hypothetical protein
MISPKHVMLAMSGESPAMLLRYVNLRDPQHRRNVRDVKARFNWSLNMKGKGAARNDLSLQ